MLGYDNIIAGSGLHQLIQRSAVTVPWQRHMSHTALSLTYWACKNMAAAYWQWSLYDTISRVMSFSNSLLAAVGPLQCVCLQSTTQHKMHIYIYIYIYITNVEYRVDLEKTCPMPKQAKVVGALTLYSTLFSIRTASWTFANLRSAQTVYLFFCVWIW
jgi:hypothetical protein